MAKTMEPGIVAKGIKLIVWLLIIYVLIVTAVFFGQRRLMYFPDTTPSDISTATIQGMQEIKAHTEDGLTLTGWFKKPRSYDHPVIIWFHGNGGKHSQREPWVRHYAAGGYGILLASYRGYAGHEGKPSEQNLYKDARAYIRAIEKLGYSVVVYGESLGSGVAVQMALENEDIRGVILHSPYTSTVDVAMALYPYLPVPWLMQDRFESKKKISNLRMPILILHGKLDDLIPVEHSEVLFEAANEPKTIQIFPRANHVDLYDHGAMAIVTRFLEFDLLKQNAAMQ